MKKLLFLMLCCLTYVGLQAQVPPPPPGCIDESLISPPICPFIFSPVCACDGIDYNNDCLAQKVGGNTEWFSPFVDCATIAANCLAPARNLEHDVTGTAVVLKWTRPFGNGAVAYRLQGRPAGTTSWATGAVVFEPTNSYSVPLSVLASGVVYEWRVQTSCAPLGVNVAPESAISTFTTPAAKVGASQSGLAIYPNPVADQLNMTYMTMENVDFSYQIIDMMGRVHQYGAIDLDAGIQQFSLDVTDLADGFYTVVMNSDTKKIVERFIKE